MRLLERIIRAVKAVLCPDKTPLEKWAEEMERDAYERGELDL